MTGALVHEWIAPSGGSERVFEALGQAFPNADMYCLWNDSDDPTFANAKESWIARTPLRRSKIAAIPAALLAWRRMLAEQDYSWLLASSHLFAHHARFRAELSTIPKFLYVHTPARYIWVPELDGRGKNAAARLAAKALKPVDRRRAGEAQYIIANSHYVRERIARTWEMDSAVIHPPVRVERLQAVTKWRDRLCGSDAECAQRLPSQYILGASRFVSYKGLDKVIAAGESARLPVVLAGSGPDLDRLESLAREASVPVAIVKSPSDGLLFHLLQEALAFVFPAVEDFGIMPVEAQALGTPVIVNTEGGASESVVANRTGVSVNNFAGAEFKSALESVSLLRSEDCKQQAQNFDTSVFIRRIQDSIAAQMGTNY